jgi:chromosome segregation ATPase
VAVNNILTLERNGELINAIEASARQIAEYKDNYMILNNECDTLKSVIKKKEKAHDDMEEYIKDYEDKIAELEQELKDKDEVIASLKQSDITKLEMIRKQNQDNISAITNYEGDESYSHMSDLTHNHELGDMSLDQSHYGVRGRITDILSTNIQENAQLKMRLSKSNRRISDFNQKLQVDEAKIDTLEQDLNTLRAHFIAVEKEKHISDQKLKNCQFKLTNLVKDVELYKKSIEDWETAYEKIEKKCQVYEDKLRRQQQIEKNHVALQDDIMFQNPHLNLTRLSSAL